MSTSDTPAPTPFPLPYRAPGMGRRASRRQNPLQDLPLSDRFGGRSQRAFDGWLAGRIRKQSRHWRPS